MDAEVPLRRFHNVLGIPVLRLDDAGRAMAAKRLAEFRRGHEEQCPHDEDIAEFLARRHRSDRHQ